MPGFLGWFSIGHGICISSRLVGAPWPQTTQLGCLLDAMQEDGGQVAVVISKVPRLRAGGSCHKDKEKMVKVSKS